MLLPELLLQDQLVAQTRQQLSGEADFLTGEVAEARAVAHSY